MKDVSTSELKAQLNRMESRLNLLERQAELTVKMLTMEDEYPTKPVELKNLPSDNLAKWLQDNPYEEYETDFEGMKPISYGMRKRMEKVRYGKLGLVLTSTQWGIIRRLTEKNPDYGNRYDADSYFKKQGLSVNGVMKKLYNLA